MRTHPASLLSFFCLALVPAARAQEPLRLTQTEALARARTSSPLLRGASAQTAEADAKARASAAAPLPILTLGPGVGSGTGGLDEDILVTLPLELTGKRGPRVAAARREQQAARARQEQVVLDLTLRVRTAYTDVLRAQADENLARQQRELAERLVTAAENQFQAGDAPRVQVERNKIELARAQQAQQSAATETGNRLAALRSLLGLPADTPVVLDDTLTATLPDYALEPLVARALRERPELREARLLEEARGAEVAGARLQRRPDVSLEARHAHLNTVARDSTLRVVLTLPLFDTGRIAGDVQGAQAAQAQQSAQRTEQERLVRLEVETAWRSYDQARKLAAGFTGERLERATTVRDLAQLGYERGASSALELLDAVQTWRSEQIEYTRARAALALAQATLERAVGGTL